MMTGTRAALCTPVVAGMLLTLPLITIVGDNLLRKLAADEAPLLARALFDSWVHMCLGVISWTVAILQRTRSTRIWTEIILAAFFSCIIDVDHFIKARSLKLQDALHMVSPPPFHDGTFPLVLFVVALMMYGLNIGRCCSFRYRLLQLSTMYSVHMFRDAGRRGLRIGSSVFLQPHGPFIFFPFIMPFFPIVARCVIFLSDSSLPHEHLNAVVSETYKKLPEDYDRSLFY